MHASELQRAQITSILKVSVSAGRWFMLRMCVIIAVTSVLCAPRSAMAQNATIDAFLYNLHHVAAPGAGTEFFLRPNFPPARLWIQSGNPSHFYNLDAGSYTLEGYYRGTFFGPEFWGLAVPTVSATQRLRVEIDRYQPYVEAVEFREDSSSGRVLGSGQSITVGTRVWAGVTVRNLAPTWLDVRVRLLMDRQRASPYAHDLISSKLSVNSGRTRRFELTFTPTESGRFYFAYECLTDVTPARPGLRTDSSVWSRTFVANEPVGSVAATLRNARHANFVLAPSAGTRFVLYTPQPLINTGSNPYTFTNVPTGVYAIEGYYNGTFFGEEYWAVENVNVTLGQTTPVTLIRHYPFVESIVLREGGSGGALLGSGQTITAGTQVWVQVTVRNNVSSQLSTQIHLLLDRNRSAPYEHDLISGFNPITSGNTRRFEFTLTPSNLGDYYYAYEAKTRLLSGQTVRTDSAGWPAQPAFTVTQPLTPLPPGKWTVIVHGRADSCDYPASYEELVTANPPPGETGNWMWRMAKKIESLDPGDVNIYRVNATSMDLTTINRNSGGTFPLDPTKHHVLLFDWARTSGIDNVIFRCPAPTGRNDGFAYAAAESLSAMLRYHSVSEDVFAFIGYSRGAVVVSEATRRLIRDGSDPGQVIYLDAEGCDSSGSTACQLYLDARFDAWQPSSGESIWFDNIFSTFDENYDFQITCADLGGHARNKTHNLNLGDSYAHTPWGLFGHCLIPGPYSQPAVWDYLIGTGPAGGLRVEGERYAYPNSPGSILDPEPLDPWLDPIQIPFNGDLEFASIAGWIGNGAAEPRAVEVDPGGLVRLGGANALLEHNWFRIPLEATELVWKWRRQVLFTGAQVTVELVDGSGTSVTAVSIPVSSLPASWAPGSLQVPSALRGSIAKIRLRVDGGLPVAVIAFDDFAITEAGACYADCDQSTGVGILDMLDFLCFQQRFVAGDPYACECDTFTGVGVCDLFDFLCFQNEFITGCP